MSLLLPKLLGYNDDAPKPCGQASRLTLANLRSKLGDGPMRFAPQTKERSIRDQLDTLNPAERTSLDYIKNKWESKYPEHAFTDEMYLRFARCSTGSSSSGGEPFSDRSALKTMKKYPRHYQHLTAVAIEQQLRSKTVFPVPKLFTINGHEVCYMRPSRCAAKTAESREVIQSLAYVLSTMMERETPCTQGVAFLANMDDFTMSNFATDYWFQFMSILQGNIVPVRVNVLLIVNAPDWFETTIWKIMKPMLSEDFAERVKMISEFELPQYLAAGYEEFLPNDMTTTGEALTDELVSDFVEYRKAIEAAQGHNNYNNNMSLARQPSMRRGSSSSRDLGSSFNQNVSLRERTLSHEDSDSSLLRVQVTKTTSSRAMGAFEKPPLSTKPQSMRLVGSSSSSKDLGSSSPHLSASFRRSLSLEDSESSILSAQTLTKNTFNTSMEASEKPRMPSKQRPGLMSKQISIRALASDVRMSLSMPSLMARQKSAKRHSSEKNANTSQTNKPSMVRSSSAAPMSTSASLKNVNPVGDDNDDNNNSDSSLNLLDLEKREEDNNNLVDTSISENTGTIDTVKATSSTSRLPSALVC